MKAIDFFRIRPLILSLFHFSALIFLVLFSRLLLSLVLNINVTRPSLQMLVSIASFFVLGYLTLLCISIMKAINRTLAIKVSKEKHRVIIMANVAVLIFLMTTWYYKFTLPHVTTKFGYSDDGTCYFQPNTSFSERNNIMTYKIDSEGHRECSHTELKSNLRVNVAGDSFIFGSLLKKDDTLCNSLGKVIAERRSKPAIVRNLGIMGIGLSSTIRIALHNAQKSKTEWTVIGYESGNAFRTMDSCVRIRLLHSSKLYQALHIAFGLNSTDVLMQRLGGIIYGRNKMYWLSPEDYERLDKLENMTNLVFFSYTDKDQFLEALEKRYPRAQFIYYNLSNEAIRDPSLIIPNDGHPTAKANKIFAEIIANKILQL